MLHKELNERGIRGTYITQITIEVAQATRIDKVKQGFHRVNMKLHQK